jgi:transcription elongation factor Elf1
LNKITEEKIMLINLQKKLDEASCPSCGKTNVLQAILSCSRNEKKCETSCVCKDCGIALIVNIPENFNQINNVEILSTSCSLETSTCEIKLTKAS